MQDECEGGDDDCYEDDNDDDDDGEGANDNQLDKTLTFYIGNLQRNAKPFSLIQHFDAKKHSGRYKEKANWKNFSCVEGERERRISWSRPVYSVYGAVFTRLR